MPANQLPKGGYDKKIIGPLTVQHIIKAYMAISIIWYICIKIDIKNVLPQEYVNFFNIIYGSVIPTFLVIGILVIVILMTIYRHG
jgi:hypothetical protein